ncbi:probable xyloglucan endotransglucosylase/hydrolase protein 8 isoform X2 [Zingiber officinale]|uniref:Xyloglucan endotransglucosylase/hydrolase n=1 Tax=Zingiber officinale TaxID=94328 RepID=A0A8J5LPT9_ZINOF|nr:probable xyloglucan endotransglucosylase/hydrolase protein 8 isoform X2 [Zingiber officinale]KAG6520755.1 hypothetical protein ZIOFF_017815 [Zingiber officinale]
MGSWKLVSLVLLFLSCSAVLSSADSGKSSTGFSFKDSFKIMPAQDHFRTSPDGQIWYLYLDKKAGGGFQTRDRYLFGWFSMKMKLVGGDSAGVVTAYYMCSDLGAGPKRDELDFEFLGNRTGQPYTIQTNVYQSGIGGREMRHSLWFDPTADFHTYSILWNRHRIVFYADRVPIRVYKNNGRKNDFFPTEKPMYMFSSIWDGDDWATRGGLEKTNWKKAPFVSSYKDFNVDGCRWEEPFPACVASTGEHWWDQSEAWVLADTQQEDFSWVGRNLVVYDYCKDTERYPELPEECNL